MVGRELPYILNLANSIMGVSLLAMPFCFMRCGILLGTVLLLTSTMLTTITCGLLVKAGIMSKRRSYEFLAYDLFGASGKLAVEVGITGVQLGICIAFHVIVGDLGPSLFSKWSGMENTATLRMILMIVSALTVSLPLSLMRNLESITKLSVLSICFYLVVVLSVFLTSWPNLVRGRWTQDVDFWNTENIFQCLPIFAMAFGCQTQMFILYEALPEPSLSALNYITRNGVNLCMVVYLVTGFFGYIAFYDKEIGGDILLSFAPSFGADLLKFGFVISVALSFPLMVFPCRQSLNTLLFSTNESLQRHAGYTGQAPMSSSKFNGLTGLIILGTLCIGINFPNVEFVIGLNGSTVGCLISFIFPAVMFLKVVNFKGEGAFQAKVVLLVGILTLCLSTYSTIQNAERATEYHQAKLDHTTGLATFIPIRELDVEPKKAEEKLLSNNLQPEQQEAPKEPAASKEAVKGEGDTRKEPPNPQPPNSNDDEKEEDSKNKPANDLEDKKHDSEENEIEKNKHTKKTKGDHKKSHKGSVDHTGQPKDAAVHVNDDLDAANKTAQKTKRTEDDEDTNKSIKKLINRLDQQAEINKDLLQQNQALLEGFKEIKKEKESLEGEVGVNKMQVPQGPPQTQQHRQIPAQQPQDQLRVQQQAQLPVQQPAQLPAQQAQLPAQQAQLPAQQAQLPAQQAQLPAQQAQLPAQQAQLPAQQAQLPAQQAQLPAQQAQLPGQAQFPAQQAQLPARQAQLPAQQAQLPAQQAQLPAQQAQLPAQQAQLPAQQAQLPAQQAQFPAQQAQLPAQQALLPAQQAQFPAQQAQFPAQPAQFPAQQAQLPAQQAQFPAQQAQLPAQQAQLPAQQAQLPAQQAQFPAQQAQLPAQQAQLPVQQAQFPAQQAQFPAQQAQLPAQQAQMPAQQAQLPAQQAQLPAQQAQLPAQQAQLPAQQAQLPAQQAQLPAQQAQFPAQQAQLPAQQTQLPAQQAQLPAQQAQLPAQQAQFPAQQAQLPVQQAQLPAQQAQLPAQQAQLPAQQAQLPAQQAQQAQLPVQEQRNHQVLPEKHGSIRQEKEKVVNDDKFIKDYEVKLAEAEDKHRQVLEDNQEIKKSLKEIIEKGDGADSKIKRAVPDDISKPDGHIIESDIVKQSEGGILTDEKESIDNSQKDNILDKEVPQSSKKPVTNNAKEEV